MGKTRANISAATKPSGGLFITFEGIEGSGKSTQCRSLAQWLRNQGYRVLETREPGGTPLAERLRACLLERQQETLTAWAEALIVLAARSQHVDQVIHPALEMGAIVLCDRFVDSTLAYQGFGRGLDPAQLARISRAASNGLVPDLTMILDVPVDVGLQRRHHNQLEINRIDAESLEFHERVRRGFRTLARRDPRRVRLIAGDRLPDVISREVERVVGRCVDARKLAKET